ncbi:DNA topoisomerase [Bombardia bombarda]|uniref:DNA topoisomerase 2 n=1 Tax=Bombardia bombarda TaxID=252184 RepID=A0AA39XNB6_9PEZI|nr:DNA topoisomerase [Bombardia bombarda]
MDSDIMDDGSVFGDDPNDESDDFMPPVKPKAAPKRAPKAPATKKALTVKAAPKKMAQSTLDGGKVASKKRPKPETDDEHNSVMGGGDKDDASILSHTPPSAKKPKTAPAKKSSGKALAEIENDSMQIDGSDADSKPKGGGKKSASQTYIKMSQEKHVLTRPDSYIGSAEFTESLQWVFNKQTKLMEHRVVNFVPGLLKLLDEVLVNAADNHQRDPTQTFIKVTINRETGECSVENNGKGIPIVMHEKEKIYVPQLIFGSLLTGSNYDDNEIKTVGGRNGYGAKLTNIFSTRFAIECQDSQNGKRYKQDWQKNMSLVSVPKISANKAADFTKVTWTADYERFKMPDGIDDDLEAVLFRRVYDIAATCLGLKVYLNGQHIKLNWKSYCEMFAQAIAIDRGDPPVMEGELPPPAKIETEVQMISGRPWQIGFTVSDGSFQTMAFCNNIHNPLGGTHVNYIADQVIAAIGAEITKKKKGHALNKANMKNHCFLFLSCLIENPSFTSQSKEYLTSKVSSFGTKCTLTDKFIKQIRQSEAINRILNFADRKADKLLAKADGGKRSRISNEKLVDANLAGTKHGHECTLILTEGDSARGLAVAGRAILDPDHIGVFPLRGKMLNVRDASFDQISKNKEIENIKKFLGLKHKQVYTDVKGLRYGSLMIMADQDLDGSHIKGLLINFLECQFPSLLRIPNFFREFITPVVKVWQGPNPKKPLKLKSFFTLPQYEEWKLEHKDELRKWKYKYFKGLGSSSNEDAQIYFTNLDDHLKEFGVMTPEASKLFELAFSKKKADSRKEWLSGFTPGTFLDHRVDKISYEEFVNKELILFSMADNMRSIPSMVDGLKPGQRKVMYACFKRNLVNDQKVIELAGYISEHTAYHHGEVSLQQTIIGLAQDYVGSNNINCLEPSGHFGSRLSGGSDAASARYIHTRLSPFARRVYSPLDEPNLEFQYDDGRKIEPKTYAPIVPMVLINGADGIGTGWSTSIPNYHPIDVVNNLKRRMGRLDPEDPEGKPFQPMMPWFRGWKGTPEQEAPNRFKFNGIARQDEERPNEIVVSELPIRVWTDDFKARLEEIIRGEKAPSFIKDYQEFNDHKTVHFVIQLEEKHMEAALKEGLLEKFKLNKAITTTNLVAFDTRGMIHKYENPEEILEEFYNYRLGMYTERKQHWLKVYHADYRRLQNQYRFISEIIENELIVSKKRKDILVKELRERKYEAFPPKADDNRKNKSTDEELVGEQEEDDDAIAGGARDYDYLLSMPIWSLTLERLEKLKKLIAAKKAEHDELDALNEKDLWIKDLDLFVEEWEASLKLDAEIESNIRRRGRRVSKKLGAGGRGKAARAPKKEKILEGDYEPAVPKKGRPPKVTKVEKVETKTQQRFAEKFGAKPKPKSKLSPLNSDGPADGLSDDDFAALGKGESEPPAPVSNIAANRSKRAAAVNAAKKKTYLVSDDSDDDFMNLGKPSASRETTEPAEPEVNGVDSDVEMARPEESEVDEMVPIPVKRAVVMSKPPPKTAYSDDDSEDFMEPLPPKRAVLSRSKSAISDDDDDFDAVVEKKPPARRAAAVKAKPVILSDDEDFDEVAEKPAKRTAAAKAKPVVLSDDDSFDAIVEKPTKRAAAAKAKPQYLDDDENSDSDDDKMLGDVGAMVKGIGAPGGSGNSQGGRLSLFAMSRPDAGETTLHKVKAKASKTNLKDDFDSHDDTNYEALAMSSPRKDRLDSFLSDDDHLPVPVKTSARAAASQASTAAASKSKAPLSVVPAAAKKPRGRPAVAAAAKAKAPAKTAVAKVVEKPKAVHLSPAAKAYAAKKAKARKMISDEEEEEDVVMEDPPSPIVRPRARPGRAAAAKAKPIIIESEGDEESEDAFAMDNSD